MLSELGLQNDRLFKLAMELEKIALEDDYFVEKKLYPNVDFYSGIVQKAIGIPTEMFTCIFALARTVGWMTQWEEMISVRTTRSAGRVSSTSAPPSAMSCRCPSAAETTLFGCPPRGHSRRDPAIPRNPAASADPTACGFARNRRFPA